MHIRRFQPDADMERLEAYLQQRYLEHRRADSWLPARLHDLVYRVSALEEDDGRERSADHIYLMEEDEEIAACILPDGENIYFSVKSGFEHVFPALVGFSEKNCLPMFAKAEDGSVRFWVAVSDSFPYMRSILEASGYSEFKEKEYMNSVSPVSADEEAGLPDGFRLMYGEEYPDEERKWSALRLGFHPECESPDYRASMRPYERRKQSSLYPYSFECIVTDVNSADDNDVCAYCFVYADPGTGTALVEPVSTREKHRHKGLGTAMMHGALKRCRESGIEKCYVDSFGSRKDFYNAAGFITEGSISFWSKTLR